MGVIRAILLVFFVIISVLLILLVLVQNENNNGMGGAFGGGQSAAFGAHSASVLTKTTGVFVGLFFVAVFVLALLSKERSDDHGLSGTAAAVQAERAADDSGATGASWVDAEDEVDVAPVVVSDAEEPAAEEEGEEPAVEEAEPVPAE